MTTDRLPLFLALARDWRAAADAPRPAGATTGDPAVRAWRQAVWCHVLFARGRYHAALSSLRAVVRDVTGELPDWAAQPASEAEAVSVAADLLARLHAAVSARRPAA